MGNFPDNRVIQQIRARRAFLATRPRPRKRLPKQIQPNLIRLEYAKEILKFLAVARQMVHNRVLPLLPALVRESAAERGDGYSLRDDIHPFMNMDAGGKKVNETLDRLSEDYYNFLTPRVLEAAADKFARRTSTHQREQLNKQIRSAVGVDVVGTDPNIAPRIADFTAENVALIKSIPQKYFDDVEKRLMAGLRDGSRAEEIAAEFEERFGISEASARLVANDQIGKLYGELNQVRQEALGVTSFVWETDQDERVRESHAELQGQAFRWDDLPEVDGEEASPGSPINCRCWASPVLDDILDSL